jgi:hypothetical protein
MVLRSFWLRLKNSHHYMFTDLDPIAHKFLRNVKKMSISNKINARAFED